MHRVCHIITKLELGGAQKITLRTVSHLDRAKFHPMLIAGGEPAELDGDAAKIPDLEFHRAPSLVRAIRPFRDLKALIQLMHLLRRLRPAIVHTHSSKAGILGRWAARLAGVPVIVHTVHGFGFTPSQHPLLRQVLIGVEKWTSAFTDWIFTDSEANRQEGIGLGLFGVNRSSMLPPGVDRLAIQAVIVDRAKKRRDLGLDERLPVVGMVAPFKPQKAPLDFVRVAVQVQRRRPDTQFVLVGDGELRGLVEQEIESVGLSRSIILTGWRRDVLDIMKCLDVFLLTSRWEGLPRVYLEAICCGIPIVGTAVAGAGEVVFEGRNGFLRQPGDVEGLAERVLWLVDHPQAAKEMGQTGTALSSRFDCYEVVRQQEHRYERLLAGLRS